MQSKHILIVGTGSAGKRHAQNLHSLGCAVSCIDPREERLEEASRENIPIKSKFLSLDQALESGEKFDAVAVTSPPSFHTDQAVAALQKGLPVLLEKPVSPDLESAKKIQQMVHDSGIPLLLGYTWRWWPSILPSTATKL